MNPQGVEAWPCGRCKACRVNRKRDWQSRLLLEAASSEAAFFVTLTYRLGQYGWIDPVDSSYHHCENLTLDRTHVQLWLKRFRKFIEPLKVRFFLCGEYGSKTLRPHYHVALFFEKSSLYVESTISKAIGATWRLGHFHIGDITSDSLAYILGYVVKGMTKSSFFPDGRYAEFRRFSRALGGRAYEDFCAGAVPLDDGRLVFPPTYRVGGKLYVVPKYLRRKARECGYEVNFSEAKDALNEVFLLSNGKKVSREALSVLVEIDRKEEELIEKRRRRSTLKLERGFIERSKNETI